MVLQFMLKNDFLLHRTYLQKTLQILPQVFNWLYLTRCLTSFSSIEHLLRLSAVFYSMSSNIDEVLSIEPSALIYLSLETLKTIISTGLLILLELINLVNSVSNGLTQMVNFPTRIPDCDSHRPAFLDLLLSSDASVCSTMASLHWEILIMLLSQFPLTFHQIHNGIHRFTPQLMTILVLIGMVFVII